MFNKIIGFFSGIGSFLFNFAKSNSGVLVSEIGDIAYDVVERVENTAPNGADKFDIAKQALIIELGERAPKYAGYILNLAIEIAHGLLVDNGKEIKK